jgi:hypothetical protein
MLSLPQSSAATRRQLGQRITFPHQRMVGVEVDGHYPPPFLAGKLIDATASGEHACVQHQDVQPAVAVRRLLENLRNDRRIGQIAGIARVILAPVTRFAGGIPVDAHHRRAARQQRFAAGLADP